MPFELSFESQGQVHLEGGEGPGQGEREAWLVWGRGGGHIASRNQVSKGGLECRVEDGFHSGKRDFLKDLGARDDIVTFI